MSVLEDRDPVAFPTLTPVQLSEMRAFGAEREVAQGELLFSAGESSESLFVVLEGEVEVVRFEGTEAVVVADYEGGGFVGELSLLTGQRRALSCRVRVAGRILEVEQDEFRRLMSVRPSLADTIFTALVARRQMLRSGDGAQAIRIIGSRYSPEAMRLRSFAEHSRLTYAWIDVEEADDVEALLETMGLGTQDTPVVITQTEIMRRPSPAEFAEHLGLTYSPTPGYIFDLVVVGSGPAGLAAAVYGASEGLTTVSVDAVAIGGQAGQSSRIENYAGFPNGISGEDLAARTAVQGMRLGARLNAACEVVARRSEPGFHVIVLADGSEIPARSVIVASGARYRRLEVDDLDRFEGAGVYYAATELEARVCDGRSVIIVGGGNSAGQAAIYLAQHNCSVKVAIRRPDLSQTMSQYLIERIEDDPRIEVMTGVEVKRLEGAEHLEQIALRHAATGELQELPCSGLFCFIGASPATAWLGDDVVLDEDGFILTDRQLPVELNTGEAPRLPFETSVPGVFAAGDVRHGSMKRVAAAVGEGSSAVRSVHERLAAGV
jgi:thioredoxin reductase (NADPH)